MMSTALIQRVSQAESTTFPIFLNKRGINWCAASAMNRFRSDENMRVLVLFGSPKRDRHTGELLDAFLKQLPVQAHVEEYHCFSSPLVPCDGCGACDVQGQCRHRDGDVLWDQLEQADVLIVATPIYFMSYPAPMKAVVDRLQRYWSIRFVLGKKPTIQRPKKGFLLTTSGSEGDQADVCLLYTSRCV